MMMRDSLVYLKNLTCLSMHFTTYNIAFLCQNVNACARKLCLYVVDKRQFFKIDVSFMFRFCSACPATAFHSITNLCKFCEVCV